MVSPSSPYIVIEVVHIQFPMYGGSENLVCFLLINHMAPWLCLQSENSRSLEEMGKTHPDLSLSDLAIYPHPFLPVGGNYLLQWWPVTSSEQPQPRPCKRVRHTLPPIEDSIVVGDGGGSGAGSPKQLSSIRRLQFRDHIWTYRQRLMAAGAVEDATGDVDGLSSDDDINEEEGADGMRLVQLLITCAEAVACRDRSQATILLTKLHTDAVVFGTSFQRVASCFVQGLAGRLALVQTLGTVRVVAPIIDAAHPEKEEALRLVYEVCPHIQFGHFVANASISEAFEGENVVHIVDLGMTLGLPKGHQWRGLMHSLASRTGGPPRRLRITGVGAPGSRLQAIGDDLMAYSKEVGVNLEFQVVKSSLENLSRDDFNLVPGEVVVVNSIFQLHRVVKESRGALNSVLQVIHGLSPRVLVLVEQDSSHNGPFFLGRFMEALHYYSAIFDSLDAMLPKYDTKRAKVEQFYFAEEIKNIVSFEGPARFERHERVDQWRRRMSRAGFQPAPIKMLAQTKQWLNKVAVCEGYTIAEEKGCLVLGWKSKPIVAASCWKC